MAFLAALGPVMAAATPYVAAASTALTVAATVGQGRAQAKQAGYAAQQLADNAKAEKAGAILDAQQERKKANLVKSRALAVAGASGTDPSSVGISNILTDIDTEGDFNVLGTLISGDYAARGLNRQAAATANEGQARKKAAYVSAGLTALDGGLSWFDKYGT